MELTISKEEKREIISSGTYLKSYCPHCNSSLIENDELNLTIIENNGEVGHLMLSPYLNVFNHKSSVRIPKRSEAKDVRCPNCDKTLIIDDRECHDCGARVIKFEVEAVSRLIDFYICARQGCTWHGLSHEDLDDIILEDSSEW
jgi:predicted RNA-binding Zn-ribbon protein involved in translation (DUF1610 family)